MSRARQLETLLVWLSLLLGVWRIAVLGVDPHHDGMILQPALVVADGGSVHGQVFEQYGLLTPWLHGLAVRIFGRTLVAVRLSSAAMLSGGIALFFAVWRDRWNRITAYVALALTVCTAYFLSPGMDMRAWSSDTLLLVQGLSLWIGTRALTRGNSWYGLLGATSTLAIFTRLGPGMVQFLLILLVVLYLGSKRVFTFLVGALTVALAVIAVLLLTRSSGEWWYQTVQGPLEFASQRAQSGVLGFAAQLGRQHLVPVIVGPVAAGLAIRGRWSSSKMGRTMRVFLATCTALWLLGSHKVLQPTNLARSDISWTVLSVSAIAILILLARSISSGVQNPFDLLQAGIVIAASSQLYPVVESRHLWWSAIPAMGLFVATSANYLVRREKSIVVGLLIGLPLTVTTTSDVLANLRLPRVEIEHLSVLRGMYFDKSYYAYFKENFNSLFFYLTEHPNTPVLNLCADGLFASITGVSDMADAYYVEWSFRSGAVSDVHRQDWVKSHGAIAWICPPSPDEYAVADAYGLRVVPLTDATRGLPNWSAWPYKNVLAVPKDWPIAEGATG